jgi:hypothetical protein
MDGIDKGTSADAGPTGTSMASLRPTTSSPSSDDYFIGDTDYDGDLLTNTNDIFSFLEGHFAGCD